MFRIDIIRQFRVKVGRRSRFSPMRIVLVSIPICVAPYSSPLAVEMGNLRNIWARVSSLGVERRGDEGQKGTEKGKGERMTETWKLFPKTVSREARDSEKRLLVEGEKTGVVREGEWKEINLPTEIIRVVIFLENVPPLFPFRRCLHPPLPLSRVIAAAYAVPPDERKRGNLCNATSPPNYASPFDSLVAGFSCSRFYRQKFY